MEKTVKKMLAEPTYGHPTRETDQRVKRLENIVLALAAQIDILNSK